jgi:hypothetical protein
MWTQNEIKHIVKIIVAASGSTPRIKLTLKSKTSHHSNKSTYVLTPDTKTSQSKKIDVTAATATLTELMNPT